MHPWELTSSLYTKRHGLYRWKVWVPWNRSDAPFDEGFGFSCSLQRGPQTSSGRSAQTCAEADFPLPRITRAASGYLYVICILQITYKYFNSNFLSHRSGKTGAVFCALRWFQFPFQIIQYPFFIRRPQRRYQIPFGAVTGDPVHHHILRHMLQT